jgi:hypothetical protein
VNALLLVAGLLGQVPALSSYPSAPVKLYLDFDGHTEPLVFGRTVTCPPYDLDGLPGTFNLQEQQIIKDVHAAVAGDWAQFQIDVTTVDPMQPSKGNCLRAVVTNNVFDWWPDKTIAGMTNVGIWQGTAPNIVFVFAKAVGGKKTRNIAIAVSHECGHAFGLEHQSDWVGDRKTGEYNRGSKVTGLAPIMGQPYGKIPQWWVGRNSKGDQQDDAAILRQVLGAR